VAMLGLLGLRIFEATGADIADLGEEHGHRVLRVCGKGAKVVLVPLPPAVSRAIDRATGARIGGPILSTAGVPGWTTTLPPVVCSGSPKPPGADHRAAPAHAPPYLRHHARCGRGLAGRPDRGPPR
jgi:integrase